MDDEFKRGGLPGTAEAMEGRLDALNSSQNQLQQAYARSRAHVRRLWLRPPMWTFEQHSPRPLDLSLLSGPQGLPKRVPSIAIVTPSFNHRAFLGATIDSVIGQDYPALSYHVQDGGSEDGSGRHSQEL